MLGRCEKRHSCGQTSAAAGRLAGVAWSWTGPRSSWSRERWRPGCGASSEEAAVGPGVAARTLSCSACLGRAHGTAVVFVRRQRAASARPGSEQHVAGAARGRRFASGHLEVAHVDGGAGSGVIPIC